MTRRAGVSILEVVLAIVVLTAIVIPVANTFSTMRSGFVAVGRHSVALGLARAVLDHIHFRIYNEDARISPMLLDDSAKMAAAEAGGGQDFFDTIAESDRIVTAQDPDKTGTYFIRINDLTSSGVIGITEENDPELYRQLRDFRCTVDVFHSVPDGVLDSDLDGNPEVDMAEVRVTISWEDDGREQSIELWNVFTRRDFNEVQ